MIPIDEPDVQSILGIPRPMHGDTVEVTPTLTLAETPAAGTEITVVDIAPAANLPPSAERRALRRAAGGLCYLALASLLAAPEAPNGVILVVEDGRSLTAGT